VPHVGCQFDGSLSSGRDDDANPKSDGTHNMHDWLMAAKVDVNHETEIANLHKYIANPHGKTIEQ
jgi:hypothetical protein